MVESSGSTQGLLVLLAAVVRCIGELSCAAVVSFSEMIAGWPSARLFFLCRDMSQSRILISCSAIVGSLALKV